MAAKEEVQLDFAVHEETGEPKSHQERLQEIYASRQQVLSFGPKMIDKDVEAEVEAFKIKKQGNDHYDIGDYEAAVGFYTTAIKMAPSAVLYANRAAAYMMLGWWEQALRDTKSALRRDPNNQKVIERQGKIHLALDNLDTALNIAAELEARIPESERQHRKKLPLNIRRLRWLAENARNPTTLDECRSVLKEFGTKAELVSPLGIRLRKTLSKVLVERSDAIDNQRKIHPAIPKNRSMDQDAGEIEEITPFAEEAIRITGELLEDNPEDAEVRFWRGRALVRLGRHADAEAQFKRGLQDAPEHLQMKELLDTIHSLDDIKARGNAFYNAGKLNEAIQLYTMGIEKDPACLDTRTVATLYFDRSAAYRRRGEFEKALEDVDMSLVLHPKWCKALYRRGILLLENGRFAEGLTELKVVQRADPTFDADLETWLQRAHNWMSKPRGESNHYKFMRLPMDSSKDDIRKQYHRLCLLWHPDKSGGTADDRQRFEELQTAYKFLMDDEKRERYDFGIWKGKPVRHHVKVRQKVKDSFDEGVVQEEACLFPQRGDRHLEEDDKVESIYWGDGGCPVWLRERRRQIYRQRYGEDPDSEDG